MSKAMNLIGQRFGRLIVIKRADNYKQIKSMWLCKCDCGKEKIIMGGSLKRGNTRSCGCLSSELVGERRRLNFGVSSTRMLIRRYKNQAKERGLEYKLTEEQFIKITQQNCYYCGAKPSNKVKVPIYNGEYIYNGLDRLDNNKGYTISNVVPCCKRCNTAKSNYNLENFKDWIERIYNKIKKERSRDNVIQTIRNDN